MKSQFVGLGVLLVASVALGAAIGNIFFALFEKTVPPAVLTSFNKGTAQMAFIAYGLVAGFFIFLWSWVAIMVSRFFREARGARCEKGCPAALCAVRASSGARGRAGARYLRTINLPFASTPPPWKT